MPQECNEWYDVNSTLSHNCLINFIVGHRGVGKTYSAKRKVIKAWIKRRRQFVYLRRYDTELKASQLSLFFDDIGLEFPDHELRVRHSEFLCDDEVFGWAIPLSKAAQYKSVPFPNVDLIIFDEFIIDQGLVRYLPDEVITFQEMYSTIARLRDVPVLFLSNAITFTNPYFLAFDVDLPKGCRIVKKNDVLVEMIDNEAYSVKYKATRFGKIIRGTKYEKYAMENEFLRDDDKFIEKLPSGAVCRAIITCSERDFGLYERKRSSIWYVSLKTDPTVTFRISAENRSHDEDTEHKDSRRGKVLWGQMVMHYQSGNMRFDSLTAKNVLGNKLINLWR